MVANILPTDTPLTQGVGQKVKLYTYDRNLSFFKVPEGIQHFPGEVQLFSGGGPIAYSL